MRERKRITTSDGVHVMKTTLVLAVLLFTTASAGAAKTCLDAYYQCLNDSWETTGLERTLADLECGLRYYGCMKGTMK
jgi:hypothetical protein